MAVKLIIDSTTDMPQALKARCTVVPLTVCFGTQEYIDGITIDYKTFYEMLVESDQLPSTSQATPAAFTRVLEALEPEDSAVIMTLSSELSGTYQSAMMAAYDYPGRVFVVDSRTAAIGAGILAELALQLIDQGMSAFEVAQALTEQRDKVTVVALLDTLEYLKRGGRISKTVAFAGAMLSIKPVAAIKDGGIHLLGKARGSRQGNNLLVQEIQKAGGVDFDKPLLLGYTGLSDTLLVKYMEDSKALWEQRAQQLRITPIGSVIGTHAGPGAIAVAFFSK